MASPKKLAHVVYMTRRFDEMVFWYRRVFEAKVQYQNPALAFLTYDDEHHRFAFANLSVLNPNGVEADNRAGIGVNHVGYTYSDLGELLMTTHARSVFERVALPAGSVASLVPEIAISKTVRQFLLWSS